MDLYRFFAADGALLYVGISLSAVHRASQHSKGQPWWDQVVRMEVEHFDADRPEMEAIERAAIRAERPRFNVIHNTSTEPRQQAWTCGACRRQVIHGYVQIVDRDVRTWQCRCTHCDEDDQFYFIELRRISTKEDLASWTHHLHGKAWFNFDDWRDMLETSCQIQGWMTALLDGRAAYMRRHRLRGLPV